MKHHITYKILLTFGILSNFLIFSCGQGEVDGTHTEIFNYQNNTTFLIEIQESKKGVVSTFNIQPTESLNYKIQVGTGGNCSINGIVNNNSECLLWYSDLIKIIFNSTRYLEFTRESISDFNLLNLDNYEVETINNERVYSYNFSELDYDNAEDCNGNCE